MPKLIKSYKKYFTTNKFHSYLVTYTIRNFEKWKKKYINIIGVHVGKKEIEGVIKNKYAIVFHVIDKTDLIEKKELVPTFLFITYKKKKIKIFTDIIKTGDSMFNHIFPGQNVMQFGNINRRGTVGLIVTIDNLPYLLSNMHVLGWSYLTTTSSVINKPINTNQPANISIQINGRLKEAGYFKSGMVTNQVDAAIALIPNRLYQAINPRRDIIDISEPIILPNQPIATPIPVRMLGNISGFKNSRIVSTVAVRTFPYPFGPLNMINLIALSPCCSEPGDSGAAVYEPKSKRIIGIVLGRDEEQRFTFVIPYPRIQNALQIP